MPRSSRARWTRSCSGTFNSGLVPLGFASSLALQVSDELANVPATRVENACASGSAAVQQGVKSLLAGTARTVLVIGAEKMTHAPSEVVGAALLGADYELAGQPSTHRLRRSLRRGGQALREAARPGRRHPRLDRREEPPQRRAQPLGPAASRPRHGLLPHRLGPEPARGRPAAPHRLLTRLGRRGGARPLDAPDRRAGRPGAPRRLRPGQRLPARVQARPARLRRHDGRVAAGDADGRRRPRRPRPHRAARLLHHRRARDLRGDRARTARRGRPAARGRHRRPGGRLPVNLSGGLKAKGHPVGATGVSQHVLAAMQLSGTAGDMQLAGARRAAVHNMGGLAVANYVSVLEAC